MRTTRTNGRIILYWPPPDPVGPPKLELIEETTGITTQIATYEDADYCGWTADGRVLLFCRPRDRRDLFRINADGSDEVTLAEHCAYGSFSPDEQKIAFVREDRTLWVVGHDGAGEKQIGENVEQKFFGSRNIAWSPDSTRVAYARDRAGIAVSNVLWGEQHVLTQGESARWPTWSPDSRSLAFDDESGTWVMSADGSEAGVCIDRDANDSAPQWSPDGTAFLLAWTTLGFTGIGKKVRLIILDAGGRRRLVQGSFQGSWSPDGQKVLFWAQHEGFEAWTVSRDGGPPKLIARRSGMVRASWLAR